jgi:hypothetical protein
MSIYIHSKLTDHYYSHGFGALFNKALNLARMNYSKTSDFCVQIDDHQINNLFDVQTRGECYPISKKDLIFDIAPDTDPLANRIIYQNVFKIKREVQKKLDAKRKELITPKTLGIHARGTDKATEYPRVSIGKIMDTIKFFVDSHEISQIFIATDDYYFIDMLQNDSRISENGLCILFDKDATISHNNEPIHHDFRNRTKINFDALSAAYLLSKCKYAAYCESNLSKMAIAMSDDSQTFIQMQR